MFTNRERPTIVRFGEQVEVVALHAEMDDTKPVDRCRAEGGPEGVEYTALAQGAELALRSHRDEHRHVSGMI